MVDRGWRASKPLELIHSDVCGPMNVLSNGKNRYFLTFIDDCSRKIWVYFLKRKSGVFEKFKHFKAYVEKESGQYIKVFRTEGGEEYDINEFNEFYVENELVHDVTL